MKIEINNLDTPYTIDMYQTFNGDSTDESMLEYYNDDNEQKKDPEKNYDYDDFDWTYNTKAIHQGLAQASIDYIKENIDQDIIQDIELMKLFSPKYYNYTTDSYTMAITFDTEKLQKYIQENNTEYTEYFFEMVKKHQANEDDITWSLLFYLQHEHDKEDYFYYIYEHSNDLWYENTEMKLNDEV